MRKRKYNKILRCNNSCLTCAEEMEPWHGWKVRFHEPTDGVNGVVKLDSGSHLKHQIPGNPKKLEAFYEPEPSWLLS